MPKALEKILGSLINSEAIIVPQEMVKRYSELERIKAYGGTHPYPKPQNVNAARLIVSMIEYFER